MKILRTPDSCFEGLKDYPFAPNYTSIKAHDGQALRVHHLDEGPLDGPIVLCMHGQPVWSYLYRHMIPYLTQAGLRVIAPDLIGYGKSDKPAAREDYSYERQVDWMGQWLKANDFSGITLFGQDWGGLIGLRLVVNHPDPIARASSQSLPEQTGCYLTLLNPTRQSIRCAFSRAQLQNGTSRDAQPCADAADLSLIRRTA